MNNRSLIESYRSTASKCIEDLNILYIRHGLVGMNKLHGEKVIELKNEISLHKAKILLLGGSIDDLR